MRKSSLLTAFAAVLLLAGFGCGPTPPAMQEPVNVNSAVNAPNLPPGGANARFGSSIQFSVGEIATFEDGLVVMLEAINDSRCKPGMVCVWEGELAATLRLGTGSDAPEVILGSSRSQNETRDTYTFNLDSITETTANVTVTQVIAPPVVKGDCRPTGCSGQICSDEDMVSDCMYRPEYACYKEATCERQPDGNCGWSQSDKLTACLADQEAGAAE